MPLEFYDIMGEDHEIWVKKVSESQVEVKIFNENQEKVFHEESHIAAWENLVYFAKQILYEDGSISN